MNLELKMAPGKRKGDIACRYEFTLDEKA